MKLPTAKQAGLAFLALTLGVPTAMAVLVDPVSREVQLLLAVWAGWVGRALVQSFAQPVPVVLPPPPSPPAVPLVVSAPPVAPVAPAPLGAAVCTPEAPWAFHPHGSEKHLAAIPAIPAIPAPVVQPPMVVFEVPPASASPLTDPSSPFAPLTPKQDPTRSE